MLDDATDTGWASIRGETWQVTTAAHVARGQKVRVVAVDGVRCASRVGRVPTEGA